MIMTMIILSITTFFFLVLYFHQRNINYKLKKKYEGFAAAYDDYGNYINSYVIFYKYLTGYIENSKKIRNTNRELFYHAILNKYRRVFEHCEK